jgi:hypothetical protein
MSHTVEKYFCREREKAVQSWRPERPNAIERDIGLEAHVQGDPRACSGSLAVRKACRLIAGGDIGNCQGIFVAAGCVGDNCSPSPASKPGRGQSWLCRRSGD